MRAARVRAAFAPRPACGASHRRSVLSRSTLRVTGAIAAAIVCVATLADVAGAQDLPANVGKSVTIDGKRIATDGRIVTIDGNQILFDGQPAIVDGKPLTTDGHNVALDGKAVVQGGKWLGRPAMLVFMIDSRWPGASAYRIEHGLTTPIERVVKTIPGVLGVDSTALGPHAQTRVVFAPSTDASITASAIRARLDQIKHSLPHDASPPIVTWRRETAERAGD